ncbi:MAG: 5-bromo-4-chloroindolyl phosphate hydrolysis family protein [Clostridia bacterium]|nr:5-bromo-4-chloroindolyl phosphate hydrolysis family protein [Clostridia bacterium]
MSRYNKSGGFDIDIPIWMIVIAFVIFWPVGFLLAILKIIGESQKKRGGHDNSAPFVNPESSYGKNEGANENFGYSENQNGYNWNGTTYSYKGAGGGDQNGGRTEPPKKKKTPVGSSLHFRKNSATTLSAAGTAVCGFLTIYNLFSGIIFGGGVFGVAASAVLTLACALSYFITNKRDYRIMGYIAMMNGVDFIKISKLSDDAGVSYDKTIKDLYYMRSKGMLPSDSILDKKIGYLILTPDAREEAEAEYRSLGGYDNAAEDYKQAESSDDISENEKTLRRIRELNDEIKDPVVSAKIDEIESLTRKIFEVVEAKPNLKPQVSKFLDYYLPTTLKLLGSYSYFENLGVRGKNIDEGMKNIEDTLDLTVQGFRKMLDSLFEAEVVDVSADISVLENMMKMDGYTQNSDFDFSGDGSGTATKKQK